MHDDYAQIAEELLDAVPEHLRDRPNPALLDSMTPRQAADHIRTGGCMACRADLRDIALEAS